MIEILENKTVLKKETKISCLKVLYILVQRFYENNYNINNIKEILKDIRNIAGNFVDDRFNEVRKIPRDLIKLLNEIEFDEKKSEINAIDKIKHRKIFETLRNYSKQNKIHKFGEYDNMVMDKLQNDVNNQGVSNLINLSNFIKNHTKNNEIKKINNNQKYLKSNNVKKFNYYNREPFFNENITLKNPNQNLRINKIKNINYF